MSITVKEYVSLAPYTVYKIGGPARFFILTSAKEEIIEAAAFARAKKLPLFILGAGSNVLISDAGYHGVAVRIAGGNVHAEDTLLYADAGVMMARAVAETARAGLAGFEWGVGIPGTIGGSVRGNAGCFGSEMKDGIESIEVFDTKQNITRKVQNRDSAFSYRDSVFKKHPEWIILSAALRLKKKEPEKIQKKIIAFMHERAEKQDIGTQSCGCIFKNFAWEKIDGGKEYALKCFPDFELFRENDTIPASFVIDHAGWKGKTLGRMRVSPKHANFFVNDGDASAEEAATLIRAVKDDVVRRYGIMLEEEIQYI